MNVYDTTPSPGFLRALRNQTWTAAGAISELVDNAFGAGRGNADHVWITHDTERKTVTVLDDGRGMQAIGQLFKLGDTIGRTPGDIGEYGSGGTWALLWLANRVDIWSLKGGLVSNDRIDWVAEMQAQSFVQVSDEWAPATPNNTPHELLACGHGTMIKLHLNPERDRKVSDAVMKLLASTYAPGLRAGKQIAWTTITKTKIHEQQLSDPFMDLLDTHDVQHFNLVVRVDGKDLTVDGQIGLFEGLSYAKSQVAVGFGHRVIMRTRECYQSEERRYSGNGIAGLLLLGDGWQPYLSTTKDDVVDAEAWDVLMAYVFAQIESLLQKTEDSKLDIVLEDLALDLEQKLRESNLKTDVWVAKETRLSGPHHTTDRPVVEPAPGEEAGQTPDPKPGIKAGADAQTPRSVSPLCKIEIHRQTDEQMDGMLCRAYVESGMIKLTINKEHPVIQACLVAHPVNKMCLNVMVVNEIADGIRANKKASEHLLPKKLINRIVDMSAEEQRRSIVRFLMDRVKQEIPPANAEALADAAD